MNKIPAMLFTAILFLCCSVQAQPVYDYKTTGNLHVAVLLVDFTDRALLPVSTVENLERMFFSDKINDPDNSYCTALSSDNYVTPYGETVYGSFRDYYREVSYDNCIVSGHVFAPVHLPNTKCNYDTNMTFDEFLSELSDSAASTTRPVDEQYNKNDFDYTIIIFAGGVYKQNLYTRAYREHNTCLTEEHGGKEDIHGIYLEPCCNKTRFTVSNFCRLDVAIHEFAHLLGTSDHYGAVLDSTHPGKALGYSCLPGGVGCWDPMASGWGDVQRPVHFCAYHKIRLGWLEPQVVLPGQVYNLEIGNIEENPQCYKIPTNSRKQLNEYFLIENRNAVGFDGNIPGEGLLITHIKDNDIQSILQADGKDDLTRVDDDCNWGDAGDLFPGTTNNTLFSIDTYPGSQSTYDDVDHSADGHMKIRNMSLLPNGNVTCQIELSPVTPAGITINSNGNYPSLEAAVFYAKPGDTVFVPSGYFLTDITMEIEKSITLRGVGYPVIRNSKIDIGKTINQCEVSGFVFDNAQLRCFAEYTAIHNNIFTNFIKEPVFGRCEVNNDISLLVYNNIFSTGNTAIKISKQLKAFGVPITGHLIPHIRNNIFHDCTIGIDAYYIDTPGAISDAQFNTFFNVATIYQTRYEDGTSVTVDLFNPPGYTNYEMPPRFIDDESRSILPQVKSVSTSACGYPSYYLEVENPHYFTVGDRINVGALYTDIEIVGFLNGALTLASPVTCVIDDAVVLTADNGANPLFNIGEITKTTGSGSGLIVDVQNALYFRPGSTIRIGDNANVTVIAVDYQTNVIAVDNSVTWNTGDHVAFPYFGSAPDIGYYEHADDAPIIHHLNDIAPHTAEYGYCSFGGIVEGDVAFGYSFNAQAGTNKKISSVEYHAGGESDVWTTIPTGELSGDLGYLPGNNIGTSAPTYSFTWNTKAQFDGEDMEGFMVRFRMEDESHAVSPFMTVGNIRIDNKNIHVWSGGDNSDGLTWATAYTDIMTADNHATDQGYVIHVAAETFEPAGYPHKITLAYDLVWQGGYSSVETGNTFRETAQDGFTRFIVHSLTGPGSKDDGLFTTNYDLTICRFEICNDGASYVASNYGAVNKNFSFINCVLNGGGYALYIYKSGGVLDLTNCTLSGVYRVSYNDGSGLTTNIASCILDDMGEVHKFATGTVNAEYSIFELSAQTPPGGTGVMTGDALLADPANGDFHVTAGSQAIDAGDPTADYSLEPSPNGGVINMGAYGNTSEAHPSDFTLLSINGTAPAAFDDDYYTVEVGPLRNQMNIEFVFHTQGSNTKKIGTVEYSLSDKPFNWMEIPVLSLSGDVGLLPGNNINGSPASYTVTWPTKDQLDGQDNLTVQVRVTLEDQSANPLYSLKAGPIHVDNKNIHLWSGGDNSDGLTWATAYTNILTVDDHATAHGYVIRAAAEVHSPGGAPHKITPDYDLEWQGGYSDAMFNTTFRESPQNGFTRFFAQSLNGPGSKDDGLFTTNHNLTMKRFEIFNTGASYIASNSGAVNNDFTLTNCTFFGGGYILYIQSHNGTATLTNCTAHDVYRVAYNDGYYLTINMNSCVIDDMGEVIKFPYKGTVNAEYCFFDVDYQTPPAGTGNIIAEDPMFVNVNNGDLHLASGSPAVDWGDPALNYHIEPHPNGGLLNMGAYGNTQDATKSSPLPAPKAPPGNGGQGEKTPVHAGTDDIALSPNPFINAVELSYTVQVPSSVNMAVYDFNGSLVKNLVTGQAMEAGRHKMQWDGRDESGRTVQPGIYIVKIQDGSGYRSVRIFKTH